MEIWPFYGLIESLHELTFSSPETLTGKTVNSLMNWAKPNAALARIEYSGGLISESAQGDPSHLKTINDAYNRLCQIDARSCRIDLEGAARTVIWAARIKSMPGYGGIIAVAAESENPFRHIMGQILELCASIIGAILTAKGARATVDIGALALTALRDFSTTGVNLILITGRPEPARGLVADIGRKQVRSMTLSAQHREILKKERQAVSVEEIASLKSAFPKDLDFQDIVWKEIKINGENLTVLMGGTFHDPEFLFSRFRGLVAELGVPLGYSEIAEMLKNLVSDHKAIVKGEKLASVIETAVAVNHEVNNPLTAILGNTQLILLNKERLPEDVILKLEIIEKSALRIRQVTQKLLRIVEPHTTSYTEGMKMLDIESSAADRTDPPTGGE